MKSLMRRMVSVLLLAVLLLGMTSEMGSRAYAMDTIAVTVGKTRQILLGATITGSLTSGSWSSDNSSVARIISQSPAECTVEGVSAGTTTIRCSYRYYTGGTYINSTWMCSVEVSNSGSDSSSTYMKLYFFNDETEDSITLDLAGVEGKKSEYVSFYTDPYTKLGVTSQWYDGLYYLSMDVSGGKPTTVTYSSADTTADGDLVFAGNTVRLTAKKVGMETITFRICSVRNKRFYGTSYGAAKLYVRVVCSHKFDQGVVVAEQSDSQHEVVDYTCTLCGEKMRKEHTVYNISYDANGGTGAPASQRKRSGNNITLPKTILTREGWTFVGWSEQPDAPAASYLPGESFARDANTTFYAVWKQPDFVLPASLTKIEADTFAGGAFTFVKVPESVVSIDTRAFENCPNLAYIYIPKTTKTIYTSAFSGVTGLTVIGVSGTRASSLASQCGFDFIPAA